MEALLTLIFIISIFGLPMGVSYCLLFFTRLPDICIKWLIGEQKPIQENNPFDEPFNIQKYDKETIEYLVKVIGDYPLTYLESVIVENYKREEFKKHLLSSNTSRAIIIEKIEFVDSYSRSEKPVLSMSELFEIKKILRSQYKNISDYEINTEQNLDLMIKEVDNRRHEVIAYHSNGLDKAIKSFRKTSDYGQIKINHK